MIEVGLRDVRIMDWIRMWCNVVVASEPDSHGKHEGAETDNGNAKLSRLQAKLLGIDCGCHTGLAFGVVRFGTVVRNDACNLRS